MDSIGTQMRQNQGKPNIGAAFTCPPNIGDLIAKNITGSGFFVRFTKEDDEWVFVDGDPEQMYGLICFIKIKPKPGDQICIKSHGKTCVHGWIRKQ
jgi:hypothetical protein